jgi:hypothetical protein
MLKTKDGQHQDHQREKSQSSQSNKCLKFSNFLGTLSPHAFLLLKGLWIAAWPTQQETDATMPLNVSYRRIELHKNATMEDIHQRNI